MAKAQEVAVVKPGYQSSEFWLAFIAQLVAAAVASGAFAEGGPVLKVLVYASAILSSLGYTAARYALKK